MKKLKKLSLLVFSSVGFLPFSPAIKSEFNASNKDNNSNLESKYVASSANVDFQNYEPQYAFSLPVKSYD